MNDNSEPDSFEKCLRWGCGFVFGAVGSFFAIAPEVPAFTGKFWATVIGIGVLLGFLAMRFGDEFWRWVSDCFRNW